MEMNGASCVIRRKKQQPTLPPLLPASNRDSSTDPTAQFLTNWSKQVSMAAYQLLGGSRNNPALLPERVASAFSPGSRVNMFSYKGPRRAKARVVWPWRAPFDHCSPSRLAVAVRAA